MGTVATRRALSCAFVLIFGLSTSAFCHGGAYKGPSDGAGGAGPSDGIATPGGLVTNPGGAASGTGKGSPGSSSASTLGGAASIRGLSLRAGGRRASPGPTAFAPSLDRWEFWWEHNKDAYLDLKTRLGNRSHATGSLGVITGRGRKRSTPQHPTPSVVQAEVLPFLLEVAASEDQRDILDSTVLALGRIAADDDAALVRTTIVPKLASRDLSVSTSATLALGVLESPQSLPLLVHLLNDDAVGRRATGGGQVHWLIRAFAAISLGLIDNEAGIRPLMDIIEAASPSDRDVTACAIVALGLMTDDDSQLIYNFLIARLQDRDQDATVRSYIPTALGKLGNPRGVHTLRMFLEDPRSEHVVRQSSAIGLGRLASASDTVTIEALIDAALEDEDVLTRHYALISLAEIGAADPIAAQHAELHARITKLLGKQVTRPRHYASRGWAALAAALYGRGRPEAAPALLGALREAYDEEPDPSNKAAFALALGLLEDLEMAPVILADVIDSQHEDFNGYACIALGLLRYEPAAETIRGICRDPFVSTTYRLQTATSLGLMADAEGIDVLLTVLAEAETLGVSAAVAQAIGLIGDADSIAILRDVAADEEATDLVRAFACVALGLVGERTRLPWNASISADNNYAAGLPSVTEILDIL
jgi:HEAT repeat protein